MPISFNQVPSNQRAPTFMAEFDSSRASQGPALLVFKALLIGQKIAAGSQTADTIVKVTNEAQVIALVGRGSQLHLMFKRWYAINKQTEVYLGVLADNGAGVAAAKTVTVTGTATAAGTISLYIGGQLMQVAVASGDVQNTIAASINTALALAANGDLPMTATVATNVVTLTARNKGTAGQDIDLRVNYQSGEALPAGVTVAFANTVSGATNPVLTNLIAAMGDVWYNIVAHPYTDATSLTALETELTSRASATRMIDAYAITSALGTQSAIGSLAATRNHAYSTIIAQPGKNPVTPPCEFAAMVAAAAAPSAAADPARPFQTLALPGAKPPADVDLFLGTERNLLLYTGAATSKVVGGVVQIDRLITTYETNASGASDTAYLDANTPLTLAYLRFSHRSRFVTKFPRHKLASDGARFGSGQAIITPKIAKGETINWFKDMEELGLVEGFDQFKNDLVVERDGSDVTRLNFLLSPDLVNQFIVGAAKFQWLL